VAVGRFCRRTSVSKASVSSYHLCDIFVLALHRIVSVSAACLAPVKSGSTSTTCIHTWVNGSLLQCTDKNDSLCQSSCSICYWLHLSFSWLTMWHNICSYNNSFSKRLSVSWIDVLSTPQMHAPIENPDSEVCQSQQHIDPVLSAMLLPYEVRHASKGNH